MSQLVITRIDHACVLLQFNGLTILTDPWFSEKTGYYRGEPLGMTIDQLPKLDAVLVSHGHYDHYDLEAFKAYPYKDVLFIVKKGIGHKAKMAGFSEIVELDHWENCTIKNMKITATPAKHKIPENTYMLEVPGMCVFFGADTLFIPELIEIAHKWPVIDVALLPVNGLTIRPLFNRQVVMNAYEAAMLCSIMQPRFAIPIHYSFTAGYIRDRILLKYTGDASIFQKYINSKVPGTQPVILPSGEHFSVSYRAI
ncbi:MAG TPA: MBL fold metallo-hydrolase [Candidatus Babeliales bacterium]|jgi:L-ascorbate metabolism protein UlaG (beta-lactamase superfamily)|nr:MBL fold metallo-hydrolase [Candidatus Babeliales bacterium]